jgi:leader peptidase (prepilin peptidase)/N-methyltransferase
VPGFVEFLVAIFVFIFGLVFGSFLNVCIYRLPRGLSVVKPRSACPHCNHPISGFDNIPVASWLILGGKCRNCKTPITPRYMIVELICGFLFLGCFLVYGPKLAGEVLLNNTAAHALILPGLRFLKYAVLCFLLLGLIFTDAETQLLPDLMTLPGLLIGLVFSLFVPMHDLMATLLFEFGVVRFPGPNHLLWESLFSSALGAFVGGGFIWSVGFLWKLVRGYEGMGFGDVKLMAMVGAFLGGATTLFVIFAASLLGSVLGLSTVAVVYQKRRGRYIKAQGSESGARRARRAAFIAYRYLPMPFGVSLGTMALVSVFAGGLFYRWLLRIP